MRYSTANPGRPRLSKQNAMALQTARIHQSRSAFDVVVRLTDMTGIVGSLMLIGTSASRSFGEEIWLAAIMAVAVYYLAAEVTGLFRSWQGVSAEREVACAALTWCLTVPALLTLGLLSGKLEIIQTALSRGGLLRWFILVPAVIAAERMICRLVLRGLRKHGWNTRGFAIVGANELGFQLARNIEGSPQMGLKLVGFFDDRPAERRGAVPSDVGACLGNLDELLEQTRDGRVHMIYITLPLRAEQRIKNVLARLSDTTASVYVVPDFFVFELLHSRWTNIGGLPAVSIFETPLYGVGGAIKRVIDVALASVFLVLASWLLVAIAVAVKLTSRGPVLFKQKRYGLDGRPISVWKFRSMSVCENGALITQATRGDPRVTRLGAFLRRRSLDELPQLFNVLEGTMSLVGPRPHANAHNEEYRKQIKGYMLRHKVKPGITGLAQVSGWRGETDTLDKMAKRVECDHQYLREWSPWLDLKILVRTVFTVLARQNAY
jgi:putative colanic acid biosynthesis UDP-glucose lipid carrier transferase